MLVPRMAYLTRGVGVHKERLTAFEAALRDAGIETQNLVSVSSIAPPGCEFISREQGEKFLIPGQILFVVMSRNETNEHHRLVGASVGVALPEDRSVHGYLSEHHDFGKTEEEMEDYVEDLAASMLASTLGVEFDPDQAWDEREKVFHMSGKILETFSTNSVAIGKAGGKWTCVIAANVLIMDWMIQAYDQRQNPGPLL